MRGTRLKDSDWPGSPREICCQLEIWTWVSPLLFRQPHHTYRIQQPHKRQGSTCENLALRENGGAQKTLPVETPYLYSVIADTGVVCSHLSWLQKHCTTRSSLLPLPGNYFSYKAVHEWWHRLVKSIQPFKHRRTPHSFHPGSFFITRFYSKCCLACHPIKQEGSVMLHVCALCQLLTCGFICTYVICSNKSCIQSEMQEGRSGERNRIIRWQPNFPRVQNEQCFHSSYNARGRRLKRLSSVSMALDNQE